MNNFLAKNGPTPFSITNYEKNIIIYKKYNIYLNIKWWYLTETYIDSFSKNEPIPVKKRLICILKPNKIRCTRMWSIFGIGGSSSFLLPTSKLIHKNLAQKKNGSLGYPCSSSRIIESVLYMRMEIKLIV